MPSFIAMLRGINVSGHNVLRMADLRQALEAAGYDRVRTYVQSGNIVLDAPSPDARLLAGQLQQLLMDQFGFKVPVVAISPEQLHDVLEQNPYRSDPDKPKNRLYFTFLQERPAPDRVAELQATDVAPESWTLIEQVIYGFSPNGFARAKFSNNFIEQKLQVTATTRTWNTVHKLLEMARS